MPQHSHHLKSSGNSAAIVTDAGERVALHVIRALGRAGIDVIATEVADRSGSCPGFHSRYADDTHILHRAERDTNSPEMARQLLQLGSEGDVLMPICLNSLLDLVQERTSVSEKFHLLAPPLESLLQANDKWQLHKIALSAGVPVPDSWCPRNENEIRELAESVKLPVIVKLRHDRGIYLPPQARYEKVIERERLLAVWRHFHALQPCPIIQTYISGEGYGFAALYDQKQKCIATFQHHRLVEYPPAGGPSAVCQSVRIPRLQRYGRRLVDSLGWEGVVMVEFLRCKETGAFYLLEINPRFWGSIALSEAAGLNFPLLYYRCARGETFQKPTYQNGIQLRLLPLHLMSGMANLGRGLEGFMEALHNLRYLLDPRVREGLMVIDDLPGFFGYVGRKLFGNDHKNE